MRVTLVDALDVGQLLARLLHAGVQVPDDGLGAQHRLAVELEHEAQHAVGRGVLRAHVDDHRLVVAALEVDVAGVDVVALGQAQHGARPRGAGRGALVVSRGSSSWAPSEVSARSMASSTLTPLLVLDLIGARLVVVPVHIAVAVLVAVVLVLVCARGRSSGTRRFLELHRHPAHAVVLAQGVAFPVLGHQDPGQVRMTFEDDPHHVVGLALHGVGAGVDCRPGSARPGPLRAPAPGCAPAGAWLSESRLTTTSKRSRLHAVGQRPPRVGQVVDGAEVGAGLEAGVRKASTISA